MPLNRFNPLHPPEGAAPPEQVKFTDLHVEPWGDNLKVRVHMRLTPFEKPPNLTAEILDSSGRGVSSIQIIENIDFDLVITMHIRPPDSPGPFTLTAKIEYDGLGAVSESRIRFLLPPNKEEA